MKEGMQTWGCWSAVRLCYRVVQFIGSLSNGCYCLRTKPTPADINKATFFWWNIVGTWLHQAFTVHTSCQVG